MKHIYLHQAAAELNLEPLSIEPDSTMWTGLETERQDLTAAQISQIQSRANELEAAKQAARLAVLNKLGLSSEEVSLLLG
jgi:hypothetical protein